MSIVTDGLRSDKWRPFAKQKLQMLKDLGLTTKNYNINGYRISLSTMDGIDKARITAPPYTSIGGGYHHVLMSDPQGDLWVWGNNQRGQLGTGDLVDRATPERIQADVPWAMIARGRGATSAAIRKDGTLWVWGYNNGSTFSEPVPELNGTLGLGLGLPDHVLTPTQIGVEHTWAFVVTGTSRSTYAIKTDGTLWVWGLDLGYLGLGAYGTGPLIVSEPTRVGLDTDWRTVSTHEAGAMAIKADGTLWAVGQNRFGALGLGDDVPRYAFTQVGSDTWRRIVVGFDSAAGIKSDGTLWATGDAPFYRPVGSIGVFLQVGAGNEWVDIASDQTALLAVKAGGSTWATGYSCDGRLGPAALPSCPTGNESTPLTELGQYATNGGIFTTQFTAVSVSPDGGQWWWGLLPGEPDPAQTVTTPQEIVGARVMLPATEPLVPPWL